MLPYLIAGAIGFGIAKLFEEGGETFGRGGMTKNQLISKIKKEMLDYGFDLTDEQISDYIQIKNLQMFETNEREEYLDFIAKNITGMSFPSYGDTTSYKQNFYQKLRKNAKNKGYNFSGETFGRGGMTNEDILRSFLTSNRETQTNNLSTHYNQYDDFLLLRNYSTLIAIRKGNDVKITNIKYSNTTSKITNRLKALAEEMGYNVSYVSKFEGGGGVRKYAKGGLFGESAKLEYVDDAFASDELKSELQEKLGISSNDLGDNVVISFAFTDYGGDFLDKVAISYFQENYPENTLVENTSYFGQNAYVFGEPAKEWIETTEDYPLGFEDFESYYYEKEYEQQLEDFDYFLDEISRDYSFDKNAVLNWLLENRSGYYNITTQGLDFSSSDLTDELVNEGLIEKIDEEDEFAEGGEAKKRRRRANAQIGKTDRSVDKTRVAKPVGYRFTNALASKLRKDKYEVPTEKQIKKYLGKGIYKENRRNESDRDLTAKL